MKLFQKYRYKEVGWVLLLMCIWTCPVKAQKFMRYYMNDKTFQGFYTESVDSIKHSVEDGKLQILHYIGDECLRIPAEKVDSIVFEGADPANGDFEGYRIYELDNEGGEFKKGYVDNRTNLIMSRSGRFAENDTILFTSAYYGYKYLLITNEDGDIARLFDGKNLLCFDYDNEDGRINVFGSVTTTLEKDENEGVETRAVGKKVFWNTCQKLFGKLHKSEVVDAALDCGSAWMGLPINCILKSMDEVQRNPELHNQLVVMNGLFVAKDIIGIAFSLAATPMTSGLSLLKFMADMVALMNDFSNLMDQISPSSEQMEIYKEYYKEKYAINLQTLPAKNITYENATLNGTFSFRGKLKGELSFSYGLLTEKNKEVNAIVVPNATNEYSYDLYAFVQGLRDGADYANSVKYKCKVDGLSFTYRSDSEFFTTSSLPDPIAITGEPSDVQSQTATINCIFKNIREGAVCGVEYSWEGGKSKQVANSQEGKQQITLSGLKPNTQYTYTAYVDYNFATYYGEEKKIQTEPVDLTGGWTCTEYIYNSFTGQTKTESYSISLYKDGTAKIHKETPAYMNATWSFKGNILKISTYTLITQTATSGVDYQGKTETPDNPISFKGAMNNWNYNSTVGYVERGGNEFMLSR